MHCTPSLDDALFACQQATGRQAAGCGQALSAAGKQSEQVAQPEYKGGPGATQLGGPPTSAGNVGAATAL